MPTQGNAGSYERTFALKLDDLKINWNYEKLLESIYQTHGELAMKQWAQHFFNPDPIQEAVELYEWLESVT